MTMRPWRGTSIAWSTAVAACILLAACADEATTLRSAEPAYTMVFFASGSTSLSKQARQEVSDFVSNPTGPVAVAMKANPPRRICVTGHSDNAGPEAANREFGQRRADAVAKYLVELGVPQDRIATSTLGSSKPLVVTPPNTSETANRRVEIVVDCPRSP